MEGAAAGFKVIRDPLWNNIQVGSEALELLDSEPLQRLRYIRQLGHAFLVYPGATHTRFEHALGTYHLASRALSMRIRMITSGTGVSLNCLTDLLFLITSKTPIVLPYQLLDWN